MTKILLTLILLSAIEVKSQPFHHEDRALKLFKNQLQKSDFKTGKVFITLDTIDMSDIFQPSTYVETEDPSKIIKMYSKFMKSIKVVGSYWNYHETVNSPFFDSPLNISYIMDTKSSTYLVSIWTDKNDICKIEGITIGKYSTKLVH